MLDLRRFFLGISLASAISPATRSSGDGIHRWAADPSIPRILTIVKENQRVAAKELLLLNWKTVVIYH